MTLFADARAVLFDLDGTLLDSAPDLALAANQMRAKRGLAELPLQHYRPLTGMGARGMLAVAFELTPEHGEAFQQHRAEFFTHYEACLLHTTHAFDGVAQVIAALQARRLPWGVVTNKATKYTQPIVQGMPQLFAGAGAVVSGDTTPHAKPHPAPLLEAARQLGLAPQHCVYVGDDERDIIAGRAAGMRTVAAAYGYLGAKPDVAQWQAHAAIKSPLELLNLLWQD